MARLHVKLLLAGSLALLAVALWQKDALPDRQLLQPDLLGEPEQVQVRKQPFETTVQGITYTIRPKYTYDLSGLVVSMHDTRTWWNYIHREWKDNLNVVDLCVVWGNNARTGVYRDVSFWNGQFWCYFEMGSREVYDAFDQAAYSNNHLITDDPEIARKLRSTRIGDQVRFRGYLAEYSHNHEGRSFNRGTSTVRTDSGDGACETVYVEDFEILRPGGGLWRTLAWVAAFLLAAGVLAWFRLPLNNKI